MRFTFVLLIALCLLILTVEAGRNRRRHRNDRARGTGQRSNNRRMYKQREALARKIVKLQNRLKNIIDESPGDRMFSVCGGQCDTECSTVRMCKQDCKRSCKLKPGNRKLKSACKAECFVNCNVTQCTTCRDDCQQQVEADMLECKSKHCGEECQLPGIGRYRKSQLNRLNRDCGKCVLKTCTKRSRVSRTTRPDNVRMVAKYLLAKRADDRLDRSIFSEISNLGYIDKDDTDKEMKRLELQQK